MKSKFSELYQFYLRKAEQPNANRELMWVFQNHLDVSTKDLIVDEMIIDLMDFPNLQQDLNDYVLGKPLAYILQSVEFYGIDFFVREGVLIPRVDTEPMVRYLIDHLPKDSNILELGVGSGAISCSLALHRKDIKVEAIDNNPICIDIAKKNINQLGLLNQIKVYLGDWYQINLHTQFDCIVANPPYIDINDPYVEESVRAYEPSDALFALDHGLRDIKQIMKLAKNSLHAEGLLVLEHGWEQQKEVMGIAQGLGFRSAIPGVDASGRPRYIVLVAP